MVMTIHHPDIQERQLTTSLEIPQAEWLKLVDAAQFLGVYPGTLYRWHRYRQLPEGACVKLDNTLYFNRYALEQIRITEATTGIQDLGNKSHD